MTVLIFLILGVMGSACSSLVKSVGTKSPADSTGVVLHKHIGYFVDIEAPKDKVWFGCVENDFKRDTAFMTFYVLDGEKSWEFHYRRIQSIAQCLRDEREYRNLLKGEKTFRIVGHHPREEAGPEPKQAQIPDNFTQVNSITSSTFIRFQVNDKCKAFFEDDCDLPKNYWGGLIPE